MKSDIVALLRVWSRWLDERVPDSAVGDDLREAANEIEWTRAERDEARRALCIAMADDITSATEFAAQRGWDCFAEVRP